jgi:IS66 Orf2 like protein
MIQITPQMRVLVAIERVDGRKGIDSLVRLCQEKLAEDPFSGCVFVFRSCSGTTIRLLSYDGQGYWLATYTGRKSRKYWCGLWDRRRWRPLSTRSNGCVAVHADRYIPHKSRKEWVPKNTTRPRQR